MASPATRRPVLPGAVRILFIAIVLGGLLGACASGAGGATRLLSYQRVWPEGLTEQQTIWSDGRIEMKHGETLERFTISAAAVARIQDALTRPIPTGSPDDSPKRTLTLATGTVVDAPRPDRDTVTELLERLLDTHTL